MLEPGVLTLAATPIGNPLDASVRLVRALAEADLIAAEDTRRLERLRQSLEVTIGARILSYHEHNEAERTGTLLEALEEGHRVLLLTDAGMPAVSDPGYQAVRAAAEAGHRVTLLPGPSAVLAALALSGLPTDRFTFEGFAPRREGRRSTAFEALATEERTMVFFESPRRTAETLAAMAECFGPQRRGVVARELTKTHEEVLRAPLGELALWARDHDVLGEVVLVVAGAEPVAASPEELLGRVRERVAAGERLREVVKDVARGVPGVRSRDLYDLAVRDQA